MQFNKEEALDIISDLLSTIAWLGGDSFEIEATYPTVSKAENFLDIHRPVVVSLTSTIPSNWNKTYVDRNDSTRRVKAINKRHAKNQLNIPLKQVKCIDNGFGQLPQHVENTV